MMPPEVLFPRRAQDPALPVKVAVPDSQRHHRFDPAPGVRGYEAVRPFRSQENPGHFSPGLLEVDQVFIAPAVMPSMNRRWSSR